MSLPVPTNTKCQIYHYGNAPPGTPDVADVPCVLQPDWVGGQEHGDRASGLTVPWTHIMLLDAAIDIRDGYLGASNFDTIHDTVTIAETDGTGFAVTFVELHLRGTPNEHKRVYLDRQAPAWPTNEL